MRRFLVLLLAGALLAGCRARPPAHRILLVGVDGAEWSVLRPLLDAGRLPALARLRAEGVSGEILSIESFQASPVIWTSVATGKVPEKHGIFSFTTNLPGSGIAVPVTSTARRAEAFWNIASAAGMRVGVVGWWATWPPETVNGAMVSDHFSVKLGELNHPYPREALGAETYPADLMETLRPLRRTPEEVPRPELARFVIGELPEPPAEAAADRLGKLRIALGIDDSNSRAARKVLELFHPDVMAVYFEGVDVVQHFFWECMDPTALPFHPPPGDVERYREVIPRYYAYVDGLVGELVRLMGDDTTVLLVSDHGFGPGMARYAQGISGEHRRQAVFLGAGPNLRRGVVVEGATLLDVTPTLLYLLGLPVGADMDGHVLTAALDPALVAARPVATVPTHEPAGGREARPTPSPVDAKITERLRALGYLQ